ncbi:MAG: TonB-dependent receptor [Bacteroidota bacterium]
MSPPVPISLSTSPALRACLALWLTCLLLAATPAGAQTGKIAGVVTDAETGETLPGASVVVVGTSYGAATDLDGRYTIIGVRPGTYTLRASYVGYTETLVEEVRVQSGLTTRIEIAMQPGASDVGDEIIVTAERPAVQPDETASVQYLDIGAIEELPVTSTEEALFVQAGVFFDFQPIEGGLGGSGRGEPRYAVRGGDQTEVLWFLDGVRTTSLIEGRADQGGSYTGVNPHAVQEVQILTGGFPAEYGDAQSGIVNVVTREGGPRYEASAEVLYGPPGQRHFGNYLFDRDTQKEFIDNTLDDGTLDPAWWTEVRQDQVYDYRDLTDRQLWGSLGGPVPGLAGVDGRFFVAAQSHRMAYIYPRPINHREHDDLLGNLVLRPGNAMKLRLSGLYSRSLHSTLQENGDFINQAKYYRGWGSLLEARHLMGAAEWTHSLSPSMFYTLKLSTFSLDLREDPSAFAREGRTQDADAVTIFGFQRYDGFGDEPFDQFSFLFDRHERVGDVSLEGSLSWQIDDANLLKGGFEARLNTYDEIRSFRFPSSTTDERYWLNRGLDETYHPLQFAFYLQDKMEFKGMILNLGLRYDYFNPNRDWFTTRDLFNLAVDPDFDPALDPDGDQVDSNGRMKYSFDNVLDKPRAPARSFHRLSPRIGVSFPITEGSVLHFNYGQFYQPPPLDRMFEFGYFRPEYIVACEQALDANPSTSQQGCPSAEGDPERVAVTSLGSLEPERTVSFEVGIAQQFGDLGVLNVTGFYKDVFDQTLPRVGLFDRIVQGFDPFRGQTSNVAFVSNFSGDYGDARGFEVNFRTLFSRHVTLDFNYSFSRTTLGRATPGFVTFDSTGTAALTYDDEASKRLPTEQTFSRPHIFRANLFLRYPEGGQRWFDRALGGTSVSFLGRYVSGRAFTYLGPEDPPDTVDNQRFPAIRQIDLRLEKQVTIGAHALSVYTNITNLFNTRNLRSFGDALFDPEATPNFVEEGTITRVDGGGYDISWQTYFPPRRVVFGVRYDFR